MRKLLVFCIIILCGTEVFAQQSMPRFEIPTARSNGMGGAHVAYTDNVFALLVNPAATMRVEQKSFFALSPTVFSPQTTFELVPDIMKTLMDGDTSSLGNALNTLSASNGKMPLGLDLRELPLSIAWVADGFGFGLWDRIFVNPNISGTNVVVDAYVDLIMPVGFAFRILETDSHSIDAGITVKPFARAIAHESTNISDLIGNSFDTDNISAPLIAGAGVDAGILYRWDIGLSAGVSFDDIFTRGTVVYNILGTDPNSYYYVPFTINAGVAYDLSIGKLLNLTFAADYRDLVNLFQQDDYSKRNALLGIGLGVQVSLFDIIKLRAGMSEMLPSVGLGFDFGPFEIDAAYYGREFGNEPGQLSGAALDLTMAIRPGARKRAWPWTKGSVVGLFTKD
jgi:hypothetical protein